MTDVPIEISRDHDRIRAVQAQHGFHEATTVQGMIDVITEEEKEYFSDQPHARGLSAAKTGFLVSYPTSGGVLRLAFYHPDHGRGFYAI